VELQPGIVPAPPGSGSHLTPDGRCMLEVIESLPEDDREAFDLVRIQGLTLGEAAEVLDVSVSTVQRRVSRALMLPAKKLEDLRPT
jgi:RNA polymerase sigma factor (sigma-70 family)